jgi:tetratricopeptide (TPR) repeat protein
LGIACALKDLDQRFDRESNHASKQSCSGPRLGLRDHSCRQSLTQVQSAPQRFKFISAQCKISDMAPWNRSVPRLCHALIFLALAFAWTPRFLPAQSKPPEIDPRVEELYSEAKAAEARGDVDQAIANYQSILKISPSLSAAYNNMGALYLRQRQYAKAVDILEKGLKINSKMTSASALLGISLYEMGDYAHARPPLESALGANPKDSNVELTLANDLVKLGDLEGAATHLQQIARRDPRNQDAWYQLGKVYMQLSQIALTKLQQIDPNSVLVHEVSGEIMESMNNFDGAIIEYKKAVEMAPQQPGTHYKLGNAYWSISQWDSATKEFQAELANDPRSCTSYYKIGDIVLLQHGNPQMALDDLQKSIAICPALIEAREDRARALLRMDRYQDALPDLQAATQANPDDPTVHFLLAQAYRSLGRTQEAQTQMQLFSKLEESARAATAARAEQVMQNKQENPPQ